MTDSDTPVSNDNIEETPDTTEQENNNVVEMPTAEAQSAPRREFKVIEISATEENAAVSAQNEVAAEQPKPKRTYRKKAAAAV